MSALVRTNELRTLIESVSISYIIIEKFYILLTVHLVMILGK
jgi:hypothetical protein